MNGQRWQKGPQGAVRRPSPSCGKSWATDQRSRWRGFNPSYAQNDPNLPRPAWYWNALCSRGTKIGHLVSDSQRVKTNILILYSESDSVWSYPAILTWPHCSSKEYLGHIENPMIVCLPKIVLQLTLIDYYLRQAWDSHCSALFSLSLLVDQRLKLKMR